MNHEQLAARWHDEHASDDEHDLSSCWCCCATCDVDNPHNREALESLRASPGGADPST